MAVTKQSSGELKTRVNTYLNKLADRDTLSMAANELELMARSLPHDAFAPFLNCLLATDTSEKSPVRRHCVRLLAVLSVAHGNALSPHLSRMISTVLRRLRDPDSAVRSACVEAVSAIITHVKSPAPFNSTIKPFADAIFHEQDANVQIGASLCLAAAMEAAAPEADAAELRKLLPRALKLLKSDCFKAKTNLLLFIGAAVSAGCVKSKTLLNSVVSTAIEFLSSNDWAARKAAAVVLEKVAATEGNLGAEFRDSSVAALESRRFDKVKIVRETMNRALEMWRDLPGWLSEHISSSEDMSSSSKSSSTDPSSTSPRSSSSEISNIGKMAPNGLPASPSSASNSETSTAKYDGNKPAINLNQRRSLRARVIPFDHNDKFITLDSPTNDKFNTQTKSNDMSLICRQLAQIEDQQSNLFHLLQRLIGNSREGMSSLERRVEGLEKKLDKMSQDFPISTPRMSAFDGYCRVSSPKLRKVEGQSIGSKSSSSFIKQYNKNNRIAYEDTVVDLLKLNPHSSMLH